MQNFTIRIPWQLWGDLCKKLIVSNTKGRLCELGVYTSEHIAMYTL